MRGFVVETVGQPMRLRTFLETREHLKLCAHRVATKVECFLTTAAEEEIRLN
jgi:hypothetical protein